MDAGNKRIARNTLFMYVKFFSNMVIGLYTSRLVLEILGVSDFGLFAVVGGVLSMFTFISSSLSSATTRFLNVEMGKKDGDVNRAFNINVVLHLAFAAIIFLLAETIGLWYICNKLNVEPGKMGDAIFVYQVSILTTCMGICNTPYQGLMNAHERFQFMAVFDIVNSFVRLGCILLLSLVPRGADFSLFAFHFSLLRLYAIIFALTTANAFVVFHYIGHRDWPEIVRFHFVRGWQRYKEVLVFNNWNLLSTISMMARSSGSDLVLNSFFGTAMNGAFSISNSVKSYLSVFSSNLEAASGPQVVQSYASGNMDRCTYLANRMGRYCILLFEMLCFPALIELGFLLHLWLGDVPEHALEFTYLNLAVTGVSITCGGITNYINATGKIKWFTIEMSFFFIMCIPVGYYLFSIGFPPTTMLVCFLIADILLRIGQLLILRYYLGFDSWRYVREAYFRPAMVALIMFAVLLAYHLLNIESSMGKLLAIASCTLITAIVIVVVGLKRGERAVLLARLNRQCHD